LSKAQLFASERWRGLLPGFGCVLWCRCVAWPKVLMSNRLCRMAYIPHQSSTDYYYYLQLSWSEDTHFVVCSHVVTSSHAVVSSSVAVISHVCPLMWLCPPMSNDSGKTNDWLPSTRVFLEQSCSLKTYHQVPTCAIQPFPSWSHVDLPPRARRQQEVWRLINALTLYYSN
jgi:hypothetical protein